MKNGTERMSVGWYVKKKEGEFFRTKKVFILLFPSISHPNTYTERFKTVIMDFIHT